MYLNFLRELSESQLESVVGGSFYTWKCEHNGTPSGGSGSGSGGGGSSSSPTYIHIGNSSNIGIISLSNIYILVITQAL